MSTSLSNTEIKINQQDFIDELLNDYKLMCLSRETSLLGRKEVLTGKAKFGIFGDGKELPQIIMAKFFRNGDIRSGYYRDQTFMLAIGKLTVKQFFVGSDVLVALDALPNDGFCNAIYEQKRIAMG